tara:strand:+ start:1116 stop:1514 length:399 start_codon:yes stop_codon:yes gene_type:complete
MTAILKGYLLIIGLFSMVMGLWAMTAPDFISWYPAFEGVERKTPLANFIRTMSGVFVASGYILIRFIFSSSKVQLGTVLIYLCAFMLIGKICGLIYEDFNKHDIIAFILGLFVLIGLVVVHRHRKNLLDYDL